MKNIIKMGVELDERKWDSMLHAEHYWHCCVLEEQQPSKRPWSTLPTLGESLVLAAAWRIAEGTGGGLFWITPMKQVGGRLGHGSEPRPFLLVDRFNFWAALREEGRRFAGGVNRSSHSTSSAHLKCPTGHFKLYSHMKSCHKSKDYDRRHK